MTAPRTRYARNGDVSLAYPWAHDPVRRETFIERSVRG